VRFQSWLASHGHSLLSTLGQLSRSLAGTLMTIAMIGISLALPAVLYLLAENARVVGRGWDRSAQVSVFLRPAVDDARATALAAAVQRWADVESVRLVSRDEALAEYRALSGLGDALDALEGNPLPAVLIVRPRGPEAGWAGQGGVLERLRALPEADATQIDLQWVRRLHAAMDMVERSVLGLAVVLCIGVVLVVANTVRAAIEGRRTEIEIAKLFGATDAFVRRPFLYTGLWYGLLGGVFAWLLVTVGYLALAGPVARLAQLYASEYRLLALSGEATLSLLTGGVALGLGGAWVAVGRHLRSIEP
jgi:cell division transport system permease protein